MHPNEWQIIKLQGSHSPVDMWNMLVVNITSEQGIPNYVIDSPDSSWVRLLTYLYGLATGWVIMSDLIRRKSGYNTNAFYDRIQHKAENTVQVFISPYFTTSLNISSSRRVTQGDMSINMYAFTGGCAMFL